MQGGRWARQSSCRCDLLHDLFRNVEVRVDLLDVVVVFQRIDQLQHVLRVFLIELDVVLRDKGDLGQGALDLGVDQGFLHLLEVVGGGDDLVGFLIRLHILGAGVQGEAHELVLVHLALLHDQQAFFVELPGDGAGLGEVTILFGEDVADLGYCAVPVVAGEINQQGAASRAVAFELELFEVNAGKLAGPALDGLLDVVGGHVDVFSLGDGKAEAGVTGGGAAPQPRGDGDLTNDLGEDLAALGVYGRFVPFRGCPVTMAPHDLTSFSTVMDLFGMIFVRL